MIKIKWIFVLSLFLSSLVQAQTPSKMKSQEDEIRQIMIGMSKQLGVTCIACHNTGNFKSSEKPDFKVAQEHMKLTQILIDHGLDGKKARKADCFMCHRGQLKPDLPAAGSKEFQSLQ